jgi:hypothetical protein
LNDPIGKSIRSEGCVRHRSNQAKQKPSKWRTGEKLH